MPSRSTSGRQVERTLLLGVVIAALLVPATGVGPGADGAPARLSGLLPPHPAAALSPAPGPRPDTAAPAPSAPIGGPAYTWLLSNGSALPGLRLTQNGSSPGDLAVDPADGTLWLGYNASSPGVAPNLTLVDIADSSVIGTIPGTPNVTALLYDPSTDWMFVAEIPNATGGRVAILNATTYLPVTAPVPVGPDPDALALDPYSAELFVADGVSGNVTEISLRTFDARSISADLDAPYGADLTSLAYDPVNGDIYALASGFQAVVAVLNGSTGAAAAPEILGPYTFTIDSTILYDPVDDRLFVLERNVSYGSSILVIDPEVQAAVGSEPIAGTLGQNVYADSMVLEPSNGDVLLVGARWWSSFAEGDLGVLFPSNGTIDWTSSFLGLGPSYQAFDPRSGVDYVAHEGQSYVSGVDVANGSTALPIIDLGGSPGAGTFDPDDGELYVPEAYWDYDRTDHGSLPNAVVALTPGTTEPASPLPIGPEADQPVGFTTGYAPESLAYDPGTGRIFVANSGSDNVTLLDATTGRIEGNVSLPFAPLYAIDDPADGLVVFADTEAAEAIGASNGSLVAHYGVPYACSAPPPGLAELLAVDPTSGAVYFAPNEWACGDTPALVAWNPLNGSATEFNVNGYPFWNDVAYDPVDGDLYIAETLFDQVAVVDPTNGSTLATVGVGTSPVFVTYDPDGDLVLVADQGSDNLTVLNGSSAAGVSGPHRSVPAGNGPSAITVASAIDQVFVSDAAGGSVIEFATTPVIGSAQGLSDAVDVGTSTEIAVQASGGSGNLSYAYTGLPPGCVSEDESTLPCTPTGNGSFVVGVTVTDEVGATASATVLLTVAVAPSLRVTATPSSLDGTGNVELGALVTGGSPPFSVTWSYGDGSTGTGLGSNHVYLHPGRYRVAATLRDAAGASASNGTEVVVGGPLLVSLAVPLRPVPAGTLENWTAGVTGGVGPYTFLWSFGDGGEVTTGVEGDRGVNESSVAHAYAAPGNYTVSVTVEDGGGEVGTANTTVVESAPAPVAPAAKPFPVVDAGLGAADLAVAGALVLLRGRRRRPPTGSPAAGASAGPP